MELKQFKSVEIKVVTKQYQGVISDLVKHHSTPDQFLKFESVDMTNN